MPVVSMYSLSTSNHAAVSSKYDKRQKVKRVQVCLQTYLTPARSVLVSSPAQTAWQLWRCFLVQMQQWAGRSELGRLPVLLSAANKHTCVKAEWAVYRPGQGLLRNIDLHVIWFLYGEHTTVSRHRILTHSDNCFTYVLHIGEQSLTRLFMCLEATDLVVMHACCSISATNCSKHAQLIVAAASMHQQPQVQPDTKTAFVVISIRNQYINEKPIYR